MNAYVEKVLAEVKVKNPNEPEFIQAVEEVLSSLDIVMDKHPEYEEQMILERLTEPDRSVSFRVTWMDDQGKPHVNRGYRVQFNGAIGPYKGGLRFAGNVNLSILKCLGFEQTFKNSLTTLPIGGAKGGSDFDPHGKSDREIMNFCQAFMTELYRHIGQDVDVPAGDIGVGGREIGYLFGQYRRIRNGFENGVLTGKGLSYGGSLLRPEATGYGAMYYVEEVLRHFEDIVKGKTFVLSGYGNVTWGTAKMIKQMGGKVLTISGSDGYVYDPEGVSTNEKIEYLLKMRASKNRSVKMYADKFGCEYHPGEKVWGIPADIYMPCATQNEVDLQDAKKIAASGAKYYFEVSNMSSTPDAMAHLRENGLIIGPAKAVNAGGVAVSALEMAQNSARYSWSAEEVNAKLKNIMTSIVNNSVEAAQEYGLGFNLIDGANIAAFKKIVDAMLAQGIM